MIDIAAKSYKTPRMEVTSEVSFWLVFGGDESRND